MSMPGREKQQSIYWAFWCLGSGSRNQGLLIKVMNLPCLVAYPRTCIRLCLSIADLPAQPWLQYYWLHGGDVCCIE